MRKNKSRLAGYRLHLDRLGFSGGSSIRTVKFPLGRYDRTTREYIFDSLTEKVALAVKSDYEALYGPLNLSTYNENSKSYSLKDFYLDCLRSGAIMKHNEAKMSYDLRVISREQHEIDAKQQKMMRRKNPSFLGKIDFVKFRQEVLLSEGFRKTKKNIGFWREDSSDNETEALKKEILASTVGKGYEEQNRYWLDNYGADKSMYAASGTSSTFTLLPFDYNTPDHADPAKLIGSIEKNLQRELGDEYKGIEEYIGISDNQGGLDQIFSKVFNDFLEGNVAKIKEVILAMSAKRWRGKERELDKRLAFLSGRARKVGRPGLVANWGLYRTDFGGKIQSWLSNGFRQDKIIKQHLFGDLDDINDLCNFGRESDIYSFKKIIYDNNNLKKSFKVDLGDDSALQALFKDLQPKSSERKSLINDDDFLNELRQIFFEDNYKLAGGHLHDLRELSEDLREYPYTDSKDSGKVSDIVDSVSSMTKGLEAIWRKSVDEEEGKIDINQLEDYRGLLARLRTDLNSVYQSNVEAGLEEEKKGKTVKDKYKNIFKELPKIPAFLGDVKIKQDGAYAKYFDSVPRVRSGTDFIKSANKLLDFNRRIDNLEDLEENANRIRQALQRMLSLYRRIGSSAITEQILSKIFKKFIISDLSLVDQFDYVFRSPRAREKRGEKLELKFDSNHLLDNLEVLLRLMTIDWSKYDRVKNLNDWVCFIEIEKIRFGLITSFYDVSSWRKELGDRNLQAHFPKIKTIFERSKPSDRSSNRVINAVINTAIFSEMKGTISKMTTKEVINRYVVQPIDSEQKFNLVTSSELRYGQRRNRHQSYYINFNFANKPDNLKQDYHAFDTKKINSGTFKVKKLDGESLLRLNSSHYQMQFLDNALSNKKWQSFDIKRMSYSFIYEETCQISWSDADPRPTITKKKNSDRLFVSMPFEFNKPKAALPKDYPSRYLGLDIGEYGVASYVLDTNDLTNRNAPTSFIYNKSLRLIREGIQENKDRQKAGTFSIPNSKIQRLRDNATTAIRNRIHRLVVEHQAKPVYEREVSAFESGSGKISKIYRSIQSSDIFEGTSVNELERKNIWGLRRAIGANTGAYATSYSCSGCCRSIYGFMDKSHYTKSYAVEVLNQSLHKEEKTIKVDLDQHDQNSSGYNLVFGYVKKNIKIGDLSSMDGEDVMKAVRNFARPPTKIILDNVKSAEFKKSKFKDAEEFELVAGSQAFFRCPFDGCGYVADADIQAAFWIAFRGYLDKQRDKDTKYRNMGMLEKVQFILSEAKNLGIKPIKFDLDSRYTRLHN